MQRNQICTECGSKNLLADQESGELVCKNCSLVITSRTIDQGQEWRAFNFEELNKRSRVGLPITWTIHDKGLSTTISNRNQDASGKTLPPQRKLDAYKLRKWQRRSVVNGSAERNLTYALSELIRISHKLNLPSNVLETSCVLYRRTLQKNSIRGRSISNLAAASLYMGCRQCNILRSLNEIANEAHVNSKDIAKTYRMMLRVLNNNVPRPDVESHLSKYINILAVSGKIELLAKNILQIAHKLKLTGGRGPSGMAAAAIYIACQLNNELKSQKDVAKVAEVTEVTIRNRYKELLKTLNIEITV